MRSMLFVPGDRPERFVKALASGADAVICDLEDAVTPVTRPQARLNVADLLRTTGRPIPLWVRINPVQTDDALPDLAAVVAARPDGIVLPKARNGADLHRLDHWLEALEAQHGHPSGCIKLIALITETAHAVLNGASFTTPPARVIGYTWGAEDLAADVGASANRTAEGEFEFTFRLARSSCLLMAAAAGIAAYDTTDIEFRDVAAVERRAQASRRDGFVGKLAIHPAQLAPIHAAFTPTSDEVAWARRVIELMSAAGGQGAVALDGRMIDRPHVKQAERILAALEHR
ncbi:MAG: CoA ester lyase [Steroidobacteraceae bacterium]|nr:CoA ester lyase [Steroidobacteraceae bacterium]MBP7012510.1 CoA ester lyase [Steroidobacteraceae bacterium]